ncbi:MAG TPA: carboxypeptidase regulatory-like domain-containing protein, partial [Gemmatimonadaceae bacterium]|nr:carboxypeptidase regulatory-like domain-containing protein [Gemmatimonadaceae bacterium]
MKTPVLIAAIYLVAPGILHAQSDKTSLVIASVADAQSGQPIADAEVKLADINLSAKTDWSGEARIAKVGAGQHSFQVVKAGYDSLVVTLQVQGDSVGPVFRMVKSPTTTLAPVAVAGDPSTSYLAEFEKRRQQGRGKYLTSADLEEKK